MNVMNARGSLPKLGYTVNEAVIASGLGRTTLYELIREGKLRAVKAAGRRIILHRDLEDYFESCR
jgi:excisionase family DNA binding protein